MGQGHIDVFKDTVERCKTVERLHDSVERSREGQTLYLKDDDIGYDAIDPVFDTRIIVSGKRTFEAAGAYKGQRICVHNFANAYSPGGGVEHGANAQEESLCRCSTLYPCLDDRRMRDGFYALHRQNYDKSPFMDFIYTPGVTVFKDDSGEQLLPEEEWFDTDVITCAAPNLFEKDLSDSTLMDFHVTMFDCMFRAAILNGAEVLILGAFGCGVFCNDPDIVSRAARTVAERYMGHFRTIEFAVYCHNHESENYASFKRTFSDQIIP